MVAIGVTVYQTGKRTTSMNLQKYKLKYSFKLKKHASSDISL